MGGGVSPPRGQGGGEGQGILRCTCSAVTTSPRAVHSGVDHSGPSAGPVWPGSPSGRGAVSGSLTLLRPLPHPPLPLPILRLHFATSEADQTLGLGISKGPFIGGWNKSTYAILNFFSFWHIRKPTYTTSLRGLERDLVLTITFRHRSCFWSRFIEDAGGEGLGRESDPWQWGCQSPGSPALSHWALGLPRSRWPPRITCPHVLTAVLRVYPFNTLGA